jgi:hypothetical protein
MAAQQDLEVQRILQLLWGLVEVESARCEAAGIKTHADAMQGTAARPGAASVVPGGVPRDKLATNRWVKLRASAMNKAGKVTIQGYREVHVRIGKAVYAGHEDWSHAKALQIADQDWCARYIFHGHHARTVSVPAGLWVRVECWSSVVMQCFMLDCRGGGVRQDRRCGAVQRRCRHHGVVFQGQEDVSRSC